MSLSIRVRSTLAVHSHSAALPILVWAHLTVKHYVTPLSEQRLLWLEPGFGLFSFCSLRFLGEFQFLEGAAVSEV